jgi:hypothetical protein
MVQELARDDDVDAARRQRQVERIGPHREQPRLARHAGSFRVKIECDAANAVPISPEIPCERLQHIPGPGANIGDDDFAWVGVNQLPNTEPHSRHATE